MGGKVGGRRPSTRGALGEKDRPRGGSALLPSTGNIRTGRGRHKVGGVGRRPDNLCETCKGASGDLKVNSTRVGKFLDDGGHSDMTNLSSRHSRSFEPDATLAGESLEPTLIAALVDGGGGLGLADLAFKDLGLTKPSMLITLSMGDTARPKMLLDEDDETKGDDDDDDETWPANTRRDTAKRNLEYLQLIAPADDAARRAWQINLMKKPEAPSTWQTADALSLKRTARQQLNGWLLKLLWPLKLCCMIERTLECLRWLAYHIRCLVCSDDTRHAYGALSEEKDAFSADNMRLVNEIAFKRLRTFLIKLLRTARKSNTWVVVDQRERQRSTTAEAMLQMALEQLDEADRPTVLIISEHDKKIVDEVSKKLKEVRDERKARSLVKAETIQQVRELQEIARKISPSMRGAADGAGVVDDLHGTVQKILQLNLEGRGGEASETGSKHGESELQDLRKESYHFAGGTHRILVCKDSEGSGKGETPSSARSTPRCSLQSPASTPGSARSKGGRSSQRPQVARQVTIDELGPVTHIFAQGDERTQKQLESHLTDLHSVVMLHNFGGITQTFASLLKLVRSVADKEESERIVDHPADYLLFRRSFRKDSELKKLLQENPAVYSILKTAMQTAPSRLFSRVLTFDLVTEPLDEAIGTLLGTSNPEVQICYAAWETHHVLNHNFSWLCQRDYRINLYIINLSLATTVLSILLSRSSSMEVTGLTVQRLNHLSETVWGALSLVTHWVLSWVGASLSWGMDTPPGSDDHSPPPLLPSSQSPSPLPPSPPLSDAEISRFWKLNLLLLPALTTLLTSMRSRWPLRTKGSVCLLGGHLVLSEIFQFRSGVGNYHPDRVQAAAAHELRLQNLKRQPQQAARPTQAAGGQSAPVDASALDRSSKETTCSEAKCNLLSHNLQSILHDKIMPEADLGDSKDLNLMLVGREARCSDGRQTWEHRKNLFQALRELSKNNLPPKNKQMIFGFKAMVQSGMRPPLHPADNLVAPIDANEYIEFRLRPLLTMLEVVSPKLATSKILFDVLIILLNAVSTIIAASSYLGPECMAITVAIASSLTMASQYLRFPEQVRAINAALRELYSLLAEWVSMGPERQKDPAEFARLVQKTEEVALALVRSCTDTNRGHQPSRELGKASDKKGDHLSA